jgi:trimeric autotransporter adhesin
MLLIAVVAVLPALAVTHRGVVLFNGDPVPGASVTAVQGGRKLATATDLRGVYTFAEMPAGTWKIEVRKFGFVPLERSFDAAPASATWELCMLPLEQMRAQRQPVSSPTPRPQLRAAKEPTPSAAPEPQDELAQRAADGFLINGSLNNSATSPFGLAPSFGNNRFGGRGLYNGSIALTFDNAALDARPFSLTGLNTPRPAYSRMTGMASFGGPLQIPRLFTNGPFVFVAYQWTRNSTATTQSALMPEVAARGGVLAAPVLDPLTGAPFAANTIPQSRISPQARALLPLYPLPNIGGATRYNYQVPLLSATHQDALQSRVNKMLGSSNMLFGRFAFQSTRSDNPDLFNSLDTSRLRGIDAEANWSHRFGQSAFLNLGYQFSRLSTRVAPFFAGRSNISGAAGITGNNQDPANWGPPALVFSSGIAGLADVQSAANRDQTSGVSAAISWSHRSHNLSLGTDFRRQQFNYLAQQDPRGTFTFTGAATGADFADFLLGVPAASSIAFGNADKYLRQSVHDAYFADDWRINSAVTLNAGLRWEYGAPATERYGRLVNLSLAPGFAAATPLTASANSGPLLQPSRHGWAPRVGVAWKPVAGSSLVVRAGYGIYYDTSVYRAIALDLAQQPPLSRTLRIENSAANPLTLAAGFVASANAAALNTFAVDPRFKPGYAQNWQLSIQRDLPMALQATATYLGIKGTRAPQESLPNTWPSGALSPCPACPAGFTYLASNANSTRESGQLQLRRRLRSGVAAMLQYTFSKAIDNASGLGGTAARSIAQNWLDLAAERGLSAFDQRHVLSLQMQYSTGMGLRGGALIGGLRGALLKDWTVLSQINAGSGLPQTPVFLATVPGTGVTGTLRPDDTGAPLYAAPQGLNLNPASFAPPRAGSWGNAGRGAITGPARFALNASLARTFRLSDRMNLDLRVDAANALNHVNYTAWNVIVNGAQFGLPASANAMRSLQTTLRVRF